MFLTKECDYAIRILRGLADLETKPVGYICQREQIPLRFAYKIIKKLEHAGIVRAHRGVYGGYQLIKKPDVLTLFDVVSVIDENLFLNECLQPNSDCPRNSGENYCGVHAELARVQTILINALKEKTIDLLI